MKCLIVDDEPLAIDVIKSHLEKYNELELVGTCSNAIQAAEMIKSKQVDFETIQSLNGFGVQRRGT